MRYLIIDDEAIPESIDFTPTLALAFYLYDQQASFTDLASNLSSRFNDLQIIGSSSSSNIAENIPFETEKTIIILLELKAPAFTVEHISSNKPIYNSMTQKKEQTALLFYSQYNSWLEKHLVALKDEYPVNNFFGAVAGSGLNGEHGHGSIYYNGVFYQEGVIVLTFDTAYYQLKGSSFHDFEPISMELTVTNTVGKTITHIEDEPALELIEQMIGELTPEGIATYEYPLMFSKKSDEGREYTPLASIQSINRKENTLSLFRKIEKGSKIKIALSSSRKEIDHRMRKLCTNIRVKQESLTFFFSCAAFQKHWGTYETLYLIGLNKCLDGKAIGFHTFGEIASIHANESSTLQNQTLTAVTLFETRESI